MLIIEAVMYLYSLQGKKKVHRRSTEGMHVDSL